MNCRVSLLTLALVFTSNPGAAEAVGHGAPQGVESAPSAGTISPTNPKVTWTGGPFTAVTADPSLCTPLTCDNFALTVSVLRDVGERIELDARNGEIPSLAEQFTAKSGKPVSSLFGELAG